MNHLDWCILFVCSATTNRVARKHKYSFLIYVIPIIKRWGDSQKKLSWQLLCCFFFAWFLHFVTSRMLPQLVFLFSTYSKLPCGRSRNLHFKIYRCYLEQLKRQKESHFQGRFYVIAFYLHDIFRVCTDQVVRECTNPILGQHAIFLDTGNWYRNKIQQPTDLWHCIL